MKLIDTLKLEGEQFPAAMTRGRDVSVSAGAGSGKTRTLVGRYLALLDEGLHPRSVVAITFTDKAAREMRNRIRQAIHDWIAGGCPAEEHARWEEVEADIDAARIGTIHGLCAAILRAHPAEAQVDPRFQILEEGLAATLQAQVVQDTLAWAINQVEFACLFQQFETGQLEAILSVLLRNRLQVSVASDADALMATWSHAITNAIQRFISSKPVATALAELVELAESGDLINDAGNKLAAQVEGLLVQLHVVGTVLAQGDGLQAARALFSLRRDYFDGRTGKKTSRAKAAVASVRAQYDKFVQPWLGGKSQDDLEPDAALETRTAQLVPWLMQVFQHALQEYQNAKDVRQALDFDDLEHGALGLLHDQAIRARWQRQIEALLVDEFQDTNERQRQIVEFLAGTPDGMTGRLFIVGDAKQSIYRFRGADVSVFRQLDEDIRARGGLPLVLDITYRAHDALVHALNEILCTVMAPAGDPPPTFAIPFTPLQADRVQPETKVTAPYIEFLLGLGASSDQARISVAHLLTERLDSLNRDAGIRWDQIALLFRASTGFPEYEAALEAAGIPFVTVAGRGFYDRPEIRDLLNILRALADPWDDLAMAGLLRSPAFGLSDVAVYLLRWSKGEIPNSYQTALQGDLSYLSEPDRRQADRARPRSKHLSGLVDRVSIAELLKQVLDETHYLAILSAEPAGARLQRNVNKLLADAYASGLVRVAEFLEYIEALQGAGTREGEAPSDAGGAVRLMTIHKAKGLEFPVVVLADAARGRPPFKSPVLLDSELGLVPNPGRLNDSPMIYRLGKTLEKERGEAEDVRLLYVAATRAKEKLIVCGHQQQKLNTTWLNRLADAAGISLAEMAGQPGEWQTVALPLSKQAIRGMARVVEPRVAGIRPRSEDESAAHPKGLALFQPLVAVEIEETDPKEQPDTRQQQRLRRVTGRFRRPDGTLVGTLVHTALAQWRFPGDATLDGLLRAAALEVGLVQPDEQDATVREAIELLTRLRADGRWAEINAAPERRHEVPYTYLAAGRVTSGYIDLLYRDIQGCWQIVDFKTDAVSGEDEMRLLIAAKYGKQIQRYREAVQKLIGESAQASLCFVDYAATVRWEKISEIPT